MDRIFGYVIKNVHLYAPKDMGQKDVLVFNDKIVQIEEHIDVILPYVEEIDASGLVMIPGLIDQHVHILGGGGEGGFASRVPEVKVSELVSSGITTVVGLLGTDHVTKNIESLVAKTKELNHYGFNAYALSGSYDYPSITLTGDVRKDIVYIEEIIGCKLALSDHRSPQISKSELLRLASQVRTARLLSGKKAYLKLHIGDSEERLSLINECLNTSDIPIDIFRPTHIGRTKELLEEAAMFAKKGGVIDLTARPTSGFLDNIKYLMNQNVELSNITFSSDGMGSWSTYQDGVLDQIGYSSLNALLKTLEYLYNHKFRTLEELLPFVTSNVANALGFENKGEIKVGKDADIVLLDDSFQIQYVMSKGKLLMKNKDIMTKGYYE